MNTPESQLEETALPVLQTQPVHGHSSDIPEQVDTKLVADTSSDHLHADGPHIRLATRPDATAADEERAFEISEAARASIEKYRDYRVALQDGYSILAPEVPQEVYHFFKWSEAFNSLGSYDPSRPSALLYEKEEGGYRLWGVMYAASWEAGEAEMDRRFPLSMGQWHAHVDICIPPEGREWEALRPDSKFGLEGSISTQGECRAEGGRFLPHLFGWIVHVEIPG